MSDRVTIGSNDRLGFFGKTGSGKTYAAKRLVWEPLDRVIFHDWKAQEHESIDAPVLRTLDDVHEALFAESEEERLYKFVYVPEPGEHGLEAWDELCRLVYEKGDFHLIGDEIKGVYQQGNSVRPVSDNHEKILTRGRSRGVGATNVSQRPKKVPMETISEAEHLFAFRLNLSDDRDRIGEIVGDEHVDQLARLNTGEFLYYFEEWDEPRVSEPI